MANDIQSEVVEAIARQVFDEWPLEPYVRDYIDTITKALSDHGAVIVPKGVSELPNKWRIFDGPTPSIGPLYTSGYMDAVKHCADGLDAMLAAQESES